MPTLRLRPDAPTPLIQQIVEGVRALIERGELTPGTKLPSIRAFAASHGVSVFTAVEAYDRMVAQGLLQSHAQQGFFVAGSTRQSPPATPADEANDALTAPRFNEVWFLQHIFERRHLPLKPGCGWLPADWLFADAVRRSLRHIAAESLSLDGYGDPLGYAPLRAHIAQALEQGQHIPARSEQVLIAHGASQALDWAVRSLVRAGDVVLVDEPGYPNLMSIARFQGAQLLGVPRTAQGWDLDALERLLQQHRQNPPRVFFTQPRLQSPTGSSASLAQLHRLLKLAQQHGITLVENDLYAELMPAHSPSLASLDGLERVVYIGSFSKTITPNLRVGYVLASAAHIARMAHLKMLSGLTSSQICEQLVLHIVTHGRWRKHLKHLREKLHQAHEDTAQALLARGFELFCQPHAGLFLWARHPDIADSTQLASDAVHEGIVLAPGELFQVDAASPSPWLRFNVAHSRDSALWDYIGRWLSEHKITNH